MSRSYKKNPVVKDGTTAKMGKKYANRKIRRQLNDADEELLSGGKYKKAYESWDIRDYSFTKTFEDYKIDAIREWEKTGFYGRTLREIQPSEKELYRDWYLTYKGK